MHCKAVDDAFSCLPVCLSVCLPVSESLSVCLPTHLIFLSLCFSLYDFSATKWQSKPVWVIACVYVCVRVLCVCVCAVIYIYLDMLLLLLLLLLWLQSFKGWWPRLVTSEPISPLQVESGRALAPCRIIISALRHETQTQSCCWSVLGEYGRDWGKGGSEWVSVCIWARVCMCMLGWGGLQCVGLFFWISLRPVRGNVSPSYLSDYRWGVAVWMHSPLTWIQHQGTYLRGGKSPAVYNINNLWRQVNLVKVFSWHRHVSPTSGMKNSLVVMRLVWSH